MRRGLQSHNAHSTQVGISHNEVSVVTKQNWATYWIL